MNIKSKMLFQFIGIGCLVAIVSFFAFLSLNSLEESSASSSNIFQITHIQETMKNLVLISLTAQTLDELQTIQADFTKEAHGYDSVFEQIRDNPTISEETLYQINLDFEKFKKISFNIFSLQAEKIEQQNIFDLKYNLEKIQRYNMRTPIYETSDPELIRTIGDIQYYSKETLYQHKDQKHLDEWLEAISSLKNQIQTSEIEFDSLIKSQLLEFISNYETTAEAMGDMAIRKELIDMEHKEKFNQLQFLLSDSSRFNLKLVGDDKENSTQIILNTKYLMIFISTISIVIAIVIGYIFSTSFSRRIDSIVSMTKKISEGKLDEKIKNQGNDEIGKLCQDINIMSDKLRDNSIQLIKKEKLSAIGELSSRIAHDIRNPLSVIKISLTNIQNSKDNPEIFEKGMNRCFRAIGRITHQVDGVMDFVKESELHIESINLKEMFETLVSEFVLPDEIKVNLPTNEITISGDKVKLDSLFSNIILNAVQAMENKGILTIRISEKSNDEIQIEVEDDGPSIPEDNLEKIFEPLFTTKQVGTGLGLASCKKIVEQHNGSISVKNNPTTFTVIIPLYNH